MGQFAIIGCGIFIVALVVGVVLTAIESPAHFILLIVLPIGCMVALGMWLRNSAERADSGSNGSWIDDEKPFKEVSCPRCEGKGYLWEWGKKVECRRCQGTGYDYIRNPDY